MQTFSFIDTLIKLCHRKSFRDFDPYFFLICKRMIIFHVKAFISCRFSWSFCWAGGYNIFHSFYGRMRNIFKSKCTNVFWFNKWFTQFTFHNIFKICFCRLLTYYDFSIGTFDRIHNKQCMINCHGTSMIYDKKNVQSNLTNFLVNNKKAFILYDGLQTLRRPSSWCTIPRK